MVQYQQLNGSYFMIFTDDLNVNKVIGETLSCFEVGYENNPRFKMGAWDGKKRFYEVQKKNNGYLFKIGSGFLQLLKSKVHFESPLTQDLVSNEEIMTFLKKAIPTLPFKPRKYQLKAIVEGIKNPNNLLISCVGSGKSLMIYLMLLFYWEKNEKSILVVPSISLVNQMHSDFKEYQASEAFLKDVKLIGGEYKDKTLNQPVVISTYQSLIKVVDQIEHYDNIITDESHLAKADSLQKILSQDVRRRTGLTGTLPIIQMDKMALMQVFGTPQYIVTARELMDKGQLNDTDVHCMFLNHPRNITRSGMKYQDEVKYIKESEARNKFLCNFFNKLDGVTVSLYAHTDHGERLFQLMTGLEIVSKKKVLDGQMNQNDFETMKKHNVFFVNGHTKGSLREEIRKYTNNLEKALIIANYKVFSTGINLPRLKHLVMLSSTKSYPLVVQAMGRIFRLHKDKNGKSHVWDLVDVFTYKKESYSMKHGWQRVSFYEEQRLNTLEHEINLGKYI